MLYEAGELDDIGRMVHRAQTVIGRWFDEMKARVDRWEPAECPPAATLPLREDNRSRR